MDESTSFNIRDKYLAAFACLILIIAYMILAFNNYDTKFMENLTLFMFGVFGGLLKQTATQQNVEQANVVKS